MRPAVLLWKEHKCVPSFCLATVAPCSALAARPARSSDRSATSKGSVPPLRSRLPNLSRGTIEKEARAPATAAPLSAAPVSSQSAALHAAAVTITCAGEPTMASPALSACAGGTPGGSRRTCSMYDAERVSTKLTACTPPPKSCTSSAPGGAPPSSAETTGSSPAEAAEACFREEGRACGGIALPVGRIGADAEGGMLPLLLLWAARLPAEAASSHATYE
mmetsp:Transcript_22052/g.38944  ORF Transcript_22052/g.38944 Transcript_22052/m.38944 type:complete len:220 (+) Transcript_22052:433-1092(+)